MENMHIDMRYKKVLTEACKVKACRTNDIFSVDLPFVLLSHLSLLT